MELNSAVEVLVNLAGIDTDSKAVELELSVLKLKGSPLYLLLNEIAEKQEGKIHEGNVLQKEDYASKKCA